VKAVPLNKNSGDATARDHVIPALIQLHRQPVQSRIEFQLYTIMYRIKSGLCPSYLARTAQRTSPRLVDRYGLRSANCTDFLFRACAQVSGNERSLDFAPFGTLPETICSTSSIAIFERHFKTHSFELIRFFVERCNTPAFFNATGVLLSFFFQFTFRCRQYNRMLDIDGSYCLGNSLVFDGYMKSKNANSVMRGPFRKCFMLTSSEYFV
jgi:hypothetical protein